MKAVGKRLIIEKINEGTAKTKGGLLLGETHKEDVRYTEAKVISVGDEVVAVKPGDHIFYDKHNGHKIEPNKETYYVIRLDDVVVVL
jgi:co-chaperonin GroES (HSP10)